MILYHLKLSVVEGFKSFVVAFFLNYAGFYIVRFQTTKNQKIAAVSFCARVMRSENSVLLLLWHLLLSSLDSLGKFLKLNFLG
jgi:hypothetical protein